MKTARLTSRPAVALTLAGVALLAAVSLVLLPFHAAPSHAKGASAMQCRSALSAIRNRDRGPGLRRFFSSSPSRSDGGPPSAESVRKLGDVFVAADRYHRCHRPAAKRLGVAALLSFVGIVPLTSRRYRRPEAGGGEEDRATAIRSGFSYQPALDGLRAVAILWVLAIHTGLKGFFVTGDHGVDLFFVLSGFLITTLLLREHRDVGRVSLRNFYTRRALRLFPVILLALVIGLAALIIAPHWFWSPTWRGLIALGFYAGNWIHLRDATSLGFLTPTWSLAIEEQFYVVWPLILVALLKSGRNRRQIAIVAGYGAVLAAMYRLVTTGASFRPSAGYSWYYDSLKRADALLVGCLLAAVLSPAVMAVLRRHTLVLSRLTFAALAGVILICVRQISVTDQSFLPAWGLVVLELSFAVIICYLVTLPTSHVALLLSSRWLVWLGRRSYGLYVLHLPVFALVRATGMTRNLYGNIAIMVPLSLLAAALSYRFIEAPALALKRRFHVTV